MVQHLRRGAKITQSSKNKYNHCQAHKAPTERVSWDLKIYLYLQDKQQISHGSNHPIYTRT